MSILIKTIPLLPASRNRRDRMHWAQRKRELDDWQMMIPNCPEAQRQKLGGPPRNVEIVFRKSRGVRSDSDNLYGRCKVPLDALVRRGWLYDDAPAYCQLSVREEIGDGSAATHIAVSETEAEAA